MLLTHVEFDDRTNTFVISNSLWYHMQSLHLDELISIVVLSYAMSGERTHLQYLTALFAFAPF